MRSTSPRCLRWPLLLAALACTPDRSLAPADPPPPIATAPEPTPTTTPSPRRPQAQAQALELTYLGNEGFAIRFHPAHGDPIDVLVDAVLDDGLPEYVVPPPELQGAIERGDPPFDRVALVLATHHHADHFDARAALRVLAHRPAVQLVTTAQAVERMREADPEAFVATRARIHGLRPTEATPIERTFGSITVRAFAMHHGRKRRPPVENLGLVVSVGDQSVLHVGDTELSSQELAALPWGPGDVPIDVAMVPYWHLLDDEWAQVLATTLRPTHVVAMHLPRPEAPADYFGETRTHDGLLRSLRTGPVPSLVLEQPGSRRALNPPSTSETPAGP